MIKKRSRRSSYDDGRASCLVRIEDRDDVEMGMYLEEFPQHEEILGGMGGPMMTVRLGMVNQMGWSCEVDVCFIFSFIVPK